MQKAPPFTQATVLLLEVARPCVYFAGAIKMNY
jgi:hypothetical protein